MFLKDIAKIIMGQSPNSDTCNKNGHGLPLLNGPTEYGSHHPVPVQYTTDAKKFARKGDILFCVRGSTTGRMNWADQDYAIGRGIAAIRHMNGNEYAPFLKALIDYHLNDLLKISTGSTFPNVGRDDLYNLEINDYPLPDQKNIAHILGNLDDKIELNRQINHTLEKMAMTLYRHYFIDYGLPPGEKYETDESPFGKLVDTDEMGPVPEEWHVETFYEISNIMGGGTPKTQKDDYWNGDISFFTPKDYANSLYIFSTEKNITQHGLDNCNSKLYPINTIFITARGTVGNICLAGKPMAMNQSCYALKYKYGDMNYFLYLSLRNAINRLHQISHGSVFNTITTDTFKMLHAIIATSDIMDEFHVRVNKLYKQIFLNEQETQTLLQTHSYLLPKLLSGEVRVQ